jgi:hypothetical protein
MSGLFTERDLGTALQLFAGADTKLKGGASGSSKRLVLETAVLALCARREAQHIKGSVKSWPTGS